MYFNEFELKAHFDYKKGEMEKAALGYNLLKHLRKKVVPKAPCCEPKVQQACCEN